MKYVIISGILSFFALTGNALAEKSAVVHVNDGQNHLTAATTINPDAALLMAGAKNGTAILATSTKVGVAHISNIDGDSATAVIDRYGNQVLRVTTEGDDIPIQMFFPSNQNP